MLLCNWIITFDILRMSHLKRQFDNWNVLKPSICRERDELVKMVADRWWRSEIAEIQRRVPPSRHEWMDSVILVIKYFCVSLGALYCWNHPINHRPSLSLERFWLSIFVAGDLSLSELSHSSTSSTVQLSDHFRGPLVSCSSRLTAVSEDVWFFPMISWSKKIIVDCKTINSLVVSLLSSEILPSFVKLLLSCLGFFC